MLLSSCLTIATGLHIELARRAKQWTQRDLAEKSGVSVGTIKTMESFAYKPVKVSTEIYSMVLKTLQDAGVIFLNDGRIGVQLREMPADASATKTIPAQKQK